LNPIIPVFNETNLKEILRTILALLVMTTVASLHICAQLLPVSQTMLLDTDHTGGYLGAGCSFADFNGDGWDDLSFSHHGGALRFYVGNGNSFDEVFLDIDNDVAQSKGIVWADFDNNGHQDLFVANRLVPNKLWMADGQGGYEDVSDTCGISQDNRRSYGVSVSDYDRDGWLDIFVSNYSAGVDVPGNELYRNNGDGTFTGVLDSMGMAEMETPQSFQGSWSDFNGDGWLDLHVIRDRTILPDLYYRNVDGNAMFEEAGSAGLDLTLNSMSTSVADFDRDGDWDVYVTAGVDEGNWLMVNDGSGAFTPYVESFIGEDLAINQVCWSGNWLDYDNDGWLDLHVITGISEYTLYPEVLQNSGDQPNRLYRGGEEGFINADEDFPSGSNLSFSAVVGDFNWDGFPDLVSHQIGELAQVLQAVPNGNHWLKVKLEGTESNRDAIGSELRLWQDGVCHLRQVICGTNYLGQDSRWQFFGLGTNSAVDSLVVSWPSGLEEIVFPIEVDVHLELLEGGIVEIEPIFGCLYSVACNYNPDANTDDNSCDFSCLVVENPCGLGTIWNMNSGACEAIPPACPQDFDGDLAVTTTDLLSFLSAFGTYCSD
jgi:hypothetical protein